MFKKYGFFSESIGLSSSAVRQHTDEVHLVQLRASNSSVWADIWLLCVPGVLAAVAVLRTRRN